MNSKHQPTRRTALIASAALALSLAFTTPAHALTRKPPATTAPNRTTPAREVKTGSNGGSGVLVAVAFGAIGAVAGAGAATAVLRKRRSQTVPVAATTEDSHATCVAAPVPSTESGGVDVLVKHMIDLGDRVGSESLRAEIAGALSQVGVFTQLVQPGTPFDPRHHIGIDSVPVNDPQWDQRVATTEAPGYYTTERTLRLPSVTVYRFVP